MNSKHYILIIIGIGFIILSIIAFIIIRINLNRHNLTQEDTSTKIISYPINSNENVQQRNYKGIHITASLPNTDWSLLEHTEEHGLEAGVSNISISYSGLTGFELEKSDKIIFSFKGISGIGGNGVCDKLYKFVDSDPKYIEQLQLQFKEQGMMSSPTKIEEPKIIELSGESYSKIELFNLEARRIGNQLFWKDNTSSEKYYNVMCGIKSYAINFPTVFFEIYKDNKKVGIQNTYVITVSNDATDTDLNEMDYILNSMRIKSL